jgi:SnoaL-like domain
MNGCGHVLTAPKIVIDGDEARGWNYALNIRWDREVERFWIARVSANEWHWRRGPDGWHTVRRTNVNLDGDELPRSLFRRGVRNPTISARHAATEGLLKRSDRLERVTGIEPAFSAWELTVR